MNHSHPNTTSATTWANQAPSTTRVAKKRNAIPQPVRRANGTWSVRARRMGMDIYLSGFVTHDDARRAVKKRLQEVSRLGPPYDPRAERITVGEAMQQYALERLPRLRGAAHLARRINTYLRAANLASIQVCPTGPLKAPAWAVAAGRHFAVLLGPKPNESQLHASLMLNEGCKHQLTDTTRVARARAALARKTVPRVTRADVQELVCAMQAEGLACATVRWEVQLLRSVFNHYMHYSTGVAQMSNPAVGVIVSGTPTRRGRVMTTQEQYKLAEAARATRNGVAWPALAFLAETGMRLEECISARWNDVDWDGCKLLLSSGSWGPRTVLLSLRAMDILRDLRHMAGPDERIFAITVEALSRHWRRLCKRAGIEDLRIGDLRRTAAVRLLLGSGLVSAVRCDDSIDL